MTAADTVEAKASRLLAERRVAIKFCTDGVVSAAVRGDSGIHDLRWTKDAGFSCSCPAYGRCSHIEAVAAVTMRPV